MKQCVFQIRNYHFLISLIFLFVSVKTNVLAMQTETDSELESDLIKLLTKLHEKRELMKKQNSENKNNFTHVRIENFFDLRNFISTIQSAREAIIKDKDTYHKNLLQLSEKLDKEIKENHNDFLTLKNKYEAIIEKTNRQNSQINSKKSEEIQAGASYEAKKADFDETSREWSSSLSIFSKQFRDTNSQKYSDFNQKISQVKDDITQRSKMHDNILTLKEKSDQLNIESEKITEVAKENKIDNKILAIINENMSKNIGELHSGLFNSTIFIHSLKTANMDKDNLRLLELEKNQQNELYKQHTGNIKKLLTSHEKIQYEIKDLMKKKNKLMEELSSRDIERNLRIGNIRTEVASLQKKVKEVEGMMLKNVKEHKEYLLQNEVKLKNLILVLNSLLQKASTSTSTQSPSDGYLNKILFDDKAIDIHNDVNSQIIEEISQSILNARQDS